MGKYFVETDYYFDQIPYINIDLLKVKQFVFFLHVFGKVSLNEII